MVSSVSHRFMENIDIKSWSRIHDTLSCLINAPICTIDLEGNEVLISGKLPNFSSIIRTSSYGSDMLKEDRANAVSKISDSKDKVLLYYSRDGLLNIWAPLIVNGSCIGAVGCVSLYDPSNRHLNFNEITRNSNIELDELRDAFNDLESVSKDDIKNYSTILYTVSKTIPELISEKNQHSKKISELTELYNIAKMINSMVDISEVAAYIMGFIVENFKVDNCSVIIFDEEFIKKRIYYKEDERLKEIEDRIVPEAINSKNLLVVHDIDTDFRFNNLAVKPATGSFLSFPLKIKGEIVGVLNLYYDVFDFEKKDFISVIADQLAMAVFNAQEVQEAKVTAVTDKLTGLYNRRYFSDGVKESLVKNISSSNPLSLVMLDIDDFKRYNDTNGHVKGDSLLRDVASILKEESRFVDIVCRYGGEEFIIILPGLGNEDAFNLIEGIREKISSKDFYGRAKQPNGKVTISAGLVTCMDKSVRYEELIEFVDQALYKSKVKGKDRVTNVVIVDKNLPQVDVSEVNEFHNHN